MLKKLVSKIGVEPRRILKKLLSQNDNKNISYKWRFVFISDKSIVPRLSPVSQIDIDKFSNYQNTKKAKLHEALQIYHQCYQNLKRFCLWCKWKKVLCFLRSLISDHQLGMKQFQFYAYNQMQSRLKTMGHTFHNLKPKSSKYNNYTMY